MIIAIGLFTLASGFFSASETSLFSLSAMRVRSFASSGSERKKLIAQLVSHPRELLVTILMMNVAVNIMVQNVSSQAFGELSGWGLRVGVPLALTLVFGEIVPKSLAIQNNTFIAYYIAPVIAFMQRLLGPLRKLVTSITTLLSRLIFSFLRSEEAISGDELKHMLSTSERHGVLHRDEAELVRGYLDLQDAQVKELMRPREEMIYYDINNSLDDLIESFVDRECSRVPVCDGDLDNLVGIMSAKRFFLNRQAIHRPSKLSPFLRKPFFVPETTPARKLLRQLSQRNEQLAIVVDEYGTVSGLIAREDLYETVVGDIEDKRDVEDLYTRSSRDVIIASGKLELTDFEDIFGCGLESPNNMVTVGGWLTEQLGDIPKSGTNYVTKDFLFHVLAAEPTRVRRIYIRRIQRNEQEGRK